MTWAYKKNTQDTQELVAIEKWIYAQQGEDGVGFSSLKARKALVWMEKRRNILLEE